MAEPHIPVVLPKQTFRWLGIGLGVVLVGYVVYRSQATLVLLGISFVIAYLLNPSIDRLECLGLPRTLAIGLLAGCMLGGIGVLFLVIIPQVQLQALQVADRAPRWGQWLYTRVTPLLEKAALPLSQYFGIAFDIDSLKTYAVRLWDWGMSHLPGITQGILSIFQTMFTGLANFIVGVLNIVLVPVLIFYLLRDFDTLHERFYSLLPPHWRPIVADWWGEIDHAVGGFRVGSSPLRSFWLPSMPRVWPLWVCRWGWCSGSSRGWPIWCRI